MVAWKKKKKTKRTGRHSAGPSAFCPYYHMHTKQNKTKHPLTDKICALNYYATLAALVKCNCQLVKGIRTEVPNDLGGTTIILFLTEKWQEASREAFLENFISRKLNSICVTKCSGGALSAMAVQATEAGPGHDLPTDGGSHHASLQIGLGSFRQLSHSAHLPPVLR